MTIQHRHRHTRARKSTYKVGLVSAEEGIDHRRHFAKHELVKGNLLLQLALPLLVKVRVVLCP